MGKRIITMVFSLIVLFLHWSYFFPHIIFSRIIQVWITIQELIWNASGINALEFHGSKVTFVDENIDNETLFPTYKLDVAGSGRFIGDLIVERDTNNKKFSTIFDDTNHHLPMISPD